jgi:hypothetical protein
VSWFETLLLVASTAALAVSVVVVVVRRRNELRQDVELTSTLERIADTIDQLRDAAGGSPELDATAGHILTRATLSQARNVYVHGGRDLIDTWLKPSELDDNHIWWADAHRDDEPTYRTLLGPVFDDAMFHAAKVGVIPREQAEAVLFWSRGTRAIIRTTPEPKRIYGIVDPVDEVTA